MCVIHVQRNFEIAILNWKHVTSCDKTSYETFHHFSYAGLHSKIISGYAKGADYRPGQKFNPGQNQHSWNAVYIYGTWCLIDAHWAARRIVGKQSTTEEYHYQLDEYFFLIDPQQHIFTHFPDDPKWQLLERPVSCCKC